jgi:cobalamin biosynthesis Co2+ chelatase CbiK
MKKIIILIFLLIHAGLHAQDANSDNCYDQYVKIFDERGAFSVEDGWHDDVVISIRYRNSNECYIGKVKVKSMNIDLNEMYFKFEDNTTEKLSKRFKNSDGIYINNGISRTMVTNEDELVNIIFPKALKPKKKAYKKAVVPVFDK